MPKIPQPLTPKKIDAAEKKDKEYNLADGQGLFLRVKPSGKKVWIFNYSEPFTQRRKNLTLGNYPVNNG